MSTHNICLYKEVDKKYTACNLKTTKSLDCALIGVCVVIRSNTVVFCKFNPLIQEGQLSVSGERMCTILVNRLED